MADYRWVCPKCGGAIHAPSRLRKQDTRRYCLRCSMKTPMLVERSAPSLEKKRAVRSEAAKAKRDALKERAHAAKYVVNGIDTYKLMKELMVLPVYGGRAGRPYKRWKNGNLDIKLHRLKGYPRSKGGHWDEYASEIHLFAWPSISEASLRETIAHELMHCASRQWPCFRTCKIHHCRHFKAKMKVAWRQLERKLGAIPGAIAPGETRYLKNGPAQQTAEAA